MPESPDVSLDIKIKYKYIWGWRRRRRIERRQKLMRSQRPTRVNLSEGLQRQQPLAPLPGYRFDTGVKSQRNSDVLNDEMRTSHVAGQRFRVAIVDTHKEKGPSLEVDGLFLC